MKRILKLVPKRFIALGLALWGASSIVFAQTEENFFPASGTPTAPKVQIVWNRYYDYAGIVGWSRQIADAYPELVRFEVIGKTYEGRDIVSLVITDFSAGKPEDKPAYYIDGNIHANEVQASEFALYTAWYLTEMRNENEFVRRLLKEKTFYIIPSINPDGRDHFFHQPNNMHSPRSTTRPLDDDRDGLTDEDGYADLDKDGHITLMRRKNPYGRYKPHPKDARLMVAVDADETGEYELLGWEGKDQDGDGEIAEDRTGYFDPNRDWAWGWQPGHIQRGAGPYPLFQTEMRLVAQYILNRPNIAGAITYHNTGGMLLRGPGFKEDAASYPAEDLKIYDTLGKKGERMMPGYKYINTFEDLYPVWGGESDWMHGALGIYAFTGELYTAYFMYNSKSEDYFGTQEDQYSFDKHLLLSDAFVDWKPYDHPQLGKIEIGGFKKNFTRMNPGFMIEQDAHRNMAFALYHAYHTPQLKLEKYTIKPLGGGLYEVTATVANTRITPTHSAHDLKNKISPPDLFELQGAEVVSNYWVRNPNLNIAEETAHQSSPVIRVENIPGNGNATVRWVVRNKNRLQLKVKSAKGGTVIFDLN